VLVAVCGHSPRGASSHTTGSVPLQSVCLSGLLSHSAARIEAIAANLCCLTSGGIVIRTEVRPVPHATWLTLATAGIPTHHVVLCQPLDPYVERVTGRHVLKRLACRLIVQEHGAAHDLGDLTPGCISFGPEVRTVSGAARFTLTATLIPTDDVAGRYALYVHVEHGAGGHILERLHVSIDDVSEARGVGYDLR
jgi:hypothetical protein